MTRPRTPAQSKLDHELILAADRGRTSEMVRLLEAGADPNVKQMWNDEPIIVQVAVWGEPADVKLLLDHGADINGADNEGLTALAAVLEYNTLDMADVLIAHGADINHQMSKGKSQPPWVIAIIQDLKSSSVGRTQYVLQRKPDFNQRFDFQGKDGQSLQDVLAAYEGRPHAEQLKALVTAHIEEILRERKSDELVAQRQEILKKHGRRDGGKFRL